MSTTYHRTVRDVLTIAGPEAVGWLQGQLSQDVAALAVGDTSWTFVLSPQGKVDGWGRVRRTADDTVVVDVDPGAGAAWRTRLERFKLRTKAEVALEEGVAMLAVRGTSPEGAVPAGWPGVEGGDLFGAEGEAALESLVAEGAAEVDAAGFEAGRLRAGVPRWGSELDEDTIPATVGPWVIDASVSFTKGCYTGQELVARIDSRGGNVPRRLAVVAADGDVPVGAEVVVDGAPAGQVTSAAADGSGGVGLAFVPRAVELPADGRIGDLAVRLVLPPVSPA